MQTSSNPENFKPGTVIETTLDTFTVDKIYRSSLLVISKFKSLETGKVETSSIPFTMLNNIRFRKEIISISEPEGDYVSPEVDFKITETNTIKEY